MDIELLSRSRQWLGALAGWHFEYWGPLTGFDTLDEYRTALDRWSSSQDIPAVLVATNHTELLGSVNVLRSEMRIRPALTPWLAQLFVRPEARRHGVGAVLGEAAIEHARRCGFPKLYLYTSGTLPEYYARLGWTELERVDYLGKPRTVVTYETARAG